MIGKAYYFKGNSISTETDDYQVGISAINPRVVATSDSSRNVVGYHGVKLSPTFARGRTIEIEGVVRATSRANLSKGMDYLDLLFALEAIPDTLQTYEFRFQDEQDRRWSIQAKIKEAIEYETDEESDYLDGADRKFRVVLESETSWYTSTTEQTATGQEGIFGGVEMGFELEVAFDDWSDEIVANSSGNVSAPCIVTITANNDIDSGLYVLNSDGSFFGLDIDAVSGDVIVVDSINKTATKNGTNILATRIAGSTWQTVGQDTSFLVIDNDQALYASDFSVEITFNDILM